MSEENVEIAKVAVGAGGGGAVLLWVAQRIIGGALDKGDAAIKAEKAAHEEERKAQRDEMAALRAALQDVSGKLSLLLDRDSHRQRRDEGMDVHVRELDRRIGALEVAMSSAVAKLEQLSEGGR